MHCGNCKENLDHFAKWVWLPIPIGNEGSCDHCDLDVSISMETRVLPYFTYIHDHRRREGHWSHGSGIHEKVLRIGIEGFGLTLGCLSNSEGEATPQPESKPSHAKASQAAG